MSESIRKVSTIFTIDDNEHNKKLKEINSQYKLTQSEIKLAGEKLNSFGKDTENLKFKQEALIKQTSTLRDKINLYTTSIEKSSTRAEENNKKLQDLKTTKEMLEAKYKGAVKAYGEETEVAIRLKEQLEEVNKQYVEQKAVVDKNISTVNSHKTKLAEAEGQIAKVQGELRKTNNELDTQNSKWIQAGESMKSAGEKLNTFGDKASKIGGTLTKTVTLPFIAATTAAVKAQVDWESAFAGVTKTVDGTTEQLADLEKGIKDMSLVLPSSAEDIAGVAEAAGQLGIQTDNILGFTKVIVDLGNATNLVGEEGASELAKFANITQMSQKDFDRLGSTIVALGNNSATTEADIVAMAMRLAGAGHQVKMTEAQIMGLAASLSSVGIEAEAGGSAFSKVMVQMQLAVETQSAGIEDFAKVSGMSISQFSKAFKEDATGAITAFIKGLGTAEQRGQSAIAVLNGMGITEVRLRDSLLRAAGAGDLFNETIALGSKAWEENTALQNEANQRYATTESQIKMLKNEIVNMAREIGVELLPTVKDGLVVVKDLIGKFNELSPATKENIIRIAAMSAAVGPAVGTLGKFAQGIGGVLKVAGILSGKLGAAKVATEAVGTAATVAAGTSGTAGLAAGLGSLVVAAGPWLLAAGLVAGAGYAIYKGLNQDVIPEVDLFADKIETTAKVMNQSYGGMQVATETTVTKISEGTKKAIGAYVELDDGAKKEMQELYLNSTVISDQIKTDMSGKFGEMATQVIQGYEKQKTDSISILQDMFLESSTITDKEQADLLAQTNSFYEDRKTSTQNHENSINAIISTASNEKRALTQSELDQITALQNSMRENAVKALSENEIEAKVILQRMKDYDTRITAEQTAEHIKKLNESRDNAVETANDEYEKRIALIERMKAEGVIKSQEQADMMINEAKRQRDGIVQSAEETRLSAIDKIRQMNSELDSEVDTGSGEVLSTWDKLKRWWTGWKPETKSFSYSINSRPSSSRMTGAQEYALGTTYFQGGFTAINEKGYEVVELPRGAKIFNHSQSENIVRDTAMETAKAIMNSMPTQSSEERMQHTQIYLDSEILGDRIDRVNGSTIKMRGRFAGLK